MNRFLSTTAATFAMVTLTTSVFAADATKPVIPAPPVVAAKEPAADAAAKIKADKLLKRKKNAKTASAGIEKKAAASTTAKKAEKLNERKRRAIENTNNLKSNLPNETTPTAPSAVK